MTDLVARTTGSVLRSSKEFGTQRRGGLCDGDGDDVVKSDVEGPAAAVEMVAGGAAGRGREWSNPAERGFAEDAAVGPDGEESDDGTDAGQVR
ncbi:hypothetical protein GCM10009827_006940 [Dactylosporangium maewongense]|uniref:Uncharacterized protein n=1 Tax=Dactylosporangium maewongense TaxID=634393 RepID=A0ABN1ZL29_9ACTN